MSLQSGEPDNEAVGHRGERRRRGALIWFGALLTALVLGCVGWIVVADPFGSSGNDVASDAAVSPTPSASQEAATTAPTPTPTTPTKAAKPTPAPCVPSTEPFTPTRISMAGVTPNAPVLALQRDANGVVGVPPITSAGKAEFAWDAPGIAPGSAKGTAIFNAHTWPDGTAIGNRMLDAVQVGSQFRVYAADGTAHCYTVSTRKEVTAETPADAISPPVYSSDSDPALVFIVCSGVRRGPGDWSHRTLFWATPS